LLNYSLSLIKENSEQEKGAKRWLRIISFIIVILWNIYKGISRSDDDSKFHSFFFARKATIFVRNENSFVFQNAAFHVGKFVSSKKPYIPQRNISTSEKLIRKKNRASPFKNITEHWTTKLIFKWIASFFFSNPLHLTSLVVAIHAGHMIMSGYFNYFR
jgi:hypothetical protein